MYGCGIGMHQFIQLRYFIFYNILVKVYFQRPLLQIYGFHCSDISVENLFFIVVANLHDFIPSTKQISSTTQSISLRIQRFLQRQIQICRSHDTFLHRCQHLNMIPRCFIIVGKIIFYQSDNLLHHFFRIFFFYIEEIRVFSIGNIWKFSFINGMCVHDDPAALGLSENPGQPNHRKHTGINNVTQYVSRANGWKLIDISHQNQPHTFWNGFE